MRVVRVVAVAPCPLLPLEEEGPGSRGLLVGVRAVLNEKKRSVPVPRFPKNAHGHTMCWRLAVGGWRLMAVGGG